MSKGKHKGKCKGKNNGKGKGNDNKGWQNKWGNVHHIEDGSNSNEGWKDDNWSSKCWDEQETSSAEPAKEPETGETYAVFDASTALDTADGWIFALEDGRKINISKLPSNQKKLLTVLAA